MHTYTINLENITKDIVNIGSRIDFIRKDKPLKFKFTNNCSYKEANELLISIYDKWNEVQLTKEICSDRISLIKKAIMYLNSFKRVITNFVLDKNSHNILFKNQADAKRFIEFVLNDIDSHIDVLKSHITDLSAWIDNSISSKINMLMKAESSLRLVSKYAEWEKDYNGKFGDASQKVYGAGK